MPFRFLISSLLAAGLMSSPAMSADLPGIKLSQTNKIRDCVTPGRLMALLRERNQKLNPRYRSLAKLYKLHGQKLGIRWDFAFFQMIVETGALKYQRGNGKPSDVRPHQNNFAGLGATGGGEHGDAFATISDGVKAHIQHLLMYAGQHVENPVAERTRKVQSWGILKKWQKRIGKPITFKHLARKWAPGARWYARNIAAVGEDFFDDFCGRPDPDAKQHVAANDKQKTMKRIARVEQKDGQLAKRTAPKVATSVPEPDKLGLGAPVDQQDTASIAGGPAKTTRKITALATKRHTTKDAKIKEQSTSVAKPSVVVKLPPRKPKRMGKANAPKKLKKKSQKLAAAPALPISKLKAAPKRPKARTTPVKKKCRVWTASYGGQKAVLIRSETKRHTNYTVLDVNEGNEKGEAETYIAAYAKGGQKIAVFANQTQALKRAFQLCPDE